MRLLFPFIENLTHIGLAKEAYVFHNKEFTDAQYFTVEYCRKTDGSLGYWVYRYDVYPAEDGATIRKEPSGDVDTPYSCAKGNWFGIPFLKKKFFNKK